MPDSLRRKIDLLIARAGMSSMMKRLSLNKIGRCFFSATDSSRTAMIRTVASPASYMPMIDEYFGIGQPADQVGAN